MSAPPLRVPHSAPKAGQSTFTLTPTPYGMLGSDLVSGAVYHNGKTYIGVIDNDGNVKVAAYNHSTNTTTISPAVVSGLADDCHSTPALLVRSSDSKIVLAVAPHSSNHLYVAVSTNAEDVSAWGSATDIVSSIGSGTDLLTYAHLVQLSGESGKIYLFYRDAITETNPTNRIYYSTSTDGGSTWSAGIKIYESSNHQSYWAICDDNISRIDFAVSDGSAAAAETASCYHFYYTGGSYFKTDGTSAGVLPLAPASITKIYDSSNGNVRAPYSITTGPIVALAAYDPAGSGQPEKYWYCTQSAGVWTANQIDTSGSVPTTAFSEGGVAIDRIDPTKVYVSRLSSGLWQLFIYSTTNGGSSWTNTQLTFDSGTPSETMNLRPITPKNENSGLKMVWCFGPHYTTGGGVEPSSAQIRGYPNPLGNL